MCGVVAWLSPTGDVDRNRLARAVAALDHRGPDAQRTWIAPHLCAGLGHARLRIIDLETGDQPIANETESVHIVVNGELYDFERIRRDLEAGGHRFRTRGDSEIALHLYEQRGLDMFGDLRGEFAFVLWDETSRTLVAARDRFGIKPLYYAELGGGIVVASEIKALLALGVEPRWDRDAFHHIWNAPLPASRSLFDGVRQVPPGHALVAREGSVRLVRYWQLPVGPVDGPSEHARDHADADALHGALNEAVRLRLRADVPVAVYLSGGVDSSSVLALAAENAGTALDTFTLCFSHDEFQAAEAYDEEDIARATAALWGARFHPIRVTPGDLATAFVDAVAQSETLHQNGHGVAKHLLSRAARQNGFKVVLTGEGADEVFAGYSWMQLDVLDPLVAASTPADVERTLGVVLGLSATQSPDLHEVRCAAEAVERQLGFLPWLLLVESWVGRMIAPLWHDDLVARTDPYAELLRSVADELPVGPPIAQSRHLWAKSALPNYILSVLGDRAEMAHSIEGRLPFLDHHVVELAARFPVTSLLRGGTDKYILRQAMRDRLTDRVYRRRKFGFAVPPSRVGLDALSTSLLDLVRSVELPFFDRRRLARFLDELPRRQHDHPVQMSYGINRIITQLASACVLQQRYRLG